MQTDIIIIICVTAVLLMTIWTSAWREIRKHQATEFAQAQRETNAAQRNVMRDFAKRLPGVDDDATP